MITEDEFFDAVDATLDKMEKEEEKVRGIMGNRVQMQYANSLRNCKNLLLNRFHYIIEYIKQTSYLSRKIFDRIIVKLIKMDLFFTIFLDKVFMLIQQDPSSLQMQYSQVPYNAVQFVMILHVALQRQQQNVSRLLVQNRHPISRVS